MKESDIVHTAGPLYVAKVPEGYDVRCHCSSGTYSVSAGTHIGTHTLELLAKAIQTADRLARYPENTRKFLGLL